MNDSPPGVVDRVNRFIHNAVRIRLRQRTTAVVSPN
jgi:hypothetical protein